MNKNTDTKTVTALDFWNSNEVSEIFAAGIGNPGVFYFVQDLEREGGDYGDLREVVETKLFSSDDETQDFWKSEGVVSGDGTSWSWNGTPDLRDCNLNYYTTISLFASAETKGRKIMNFNKVLQAVKESDDKHRVLLDKVTKDWEQLKTLCPLYDNVTILFGEDRKLVLTNEPFFFFLENGIRLFNYDTNFEEKDYESLSKIADIMNLIRNS